MAVTLAKVGQPCDLSSMMKAFAENKLQFHAILCQTTLTFDIPNASMLDIKNCVNTVADQLVQVCDYIQCLEKENHLPAAAKKWFTDNVNFGLKWQYVVLGFDLCVACVFLNVNVVLFSFIF